MEKFAVDLDKVLDDFEFNEDCAEQTASVDGIPSNTASASKCPGSTSSNTCNAHVVEPIKINKGYEVISNIDKQKDFQQVNIDNRSSLSEKDIGDSTLNYCKGESMLENIDSVNHFYPLDHANENKVIQKQCIQAQEQEQVSLTIYNDISQKLLQKQQNGNTSPKIQNRYDKKLNQPNIKPSVSNVFNSLNEYINAPTVSLNYVDTMLDKQETRSSKQSDIYEGGIGTSLKNTVKDCNLVKNILTDGNINIQNEEKGNSISTLKSPHYENICVPLTVDTSLSNRTIITEIESTEGACTSDFTIAEHKEQCDRNIDISYISGDVSEHSYENVCTDTNALQNEELCTVIEKSDSQNEDQNSDNNVIHVYENVTLNKQKDSYLENKVPVYENINVKNQNGLSEVTTYMVSSSTMSDIVHVSENVKESETGKNIYKFPVQQVFSQSNSDIVQSNLSDTIICKPHQTHKPIGFSNIDDLSEEELNKYLAELEAEERFTEDNISYQNIALPETYKKTVDNIVDTFQFQQDDEDANEAPIFESVMIGELPTVSEEELQEKAKKFPVIDYSNGSTNGETSSNFLEKQNQEKLQDSIKPVFIEKEDKAKEKKNEKDNEDAIGQEYDAENFPKNETIKSVQDVHCENKNITKTENIQSIETASTLDLHLNNELLSIRMENQVNQGNESTFDSLQYNKEISEQEILRNISVDTGEKLILEESKTNDAEDLHAQNLPKDVDLSNRTTTKHNENNIEMDKPVRPQTLDIVLAVGMDDQNSPGNTTAGQERSDAEGNEDNGREISPDISDNSLMDSSITLGKQPPFWIPDGDAPSCMLCDVKFTVLKRRHHCRACGKVLCNKCCNMKFRLEYQGNIDSRVCSPCYQLLIKAESGQGMGDWSAGYTNSASSSDINSPQLVGGLPPPPTVMVPVGVLKREGSSKQRPEGSKSVMFSDGIRPGCDLTELDTSWDLKMPYCKPGNKFRIPFPGQQVTSSSIKRQSLPPLDASTNSYVPQDSNLLPPTVTIHKGQISYHNVTDQALLYKTLKNECEAPVMFAINRNLYAYVKITNLNCCVNKICWNITSRGLACVGQDEVILLVETLPDETQVPKDLLMYINQIYIDALKGNTITELNFSIFHNGNLLGSREHAGFLFIRQTLQCLQKIILPPAPFLVGLLIHRWETPWARIFPLRLILRLGAEYRYYPCPLVSVRFRNALYFEIGHTVMKVLADFRNFGYTLPGVRGLAIHLKDRTTDVMFPRNRYDQVIKGLNNSNDHVLAYASNFSITADSHLVCIQTNTGDESSYQTQAINIHNKPRTVTGASFIVINGALKSSMGLSAKSSIVEDGLMVEIMPEKMEALKAALKNMQDFSIGCGKQGAPNPDETVNIKWVDNDTQFNLGVKSPIDGQLMDGIPSIRVHNGIDYKGTSRIIRWTEVFIIKSDDHPNAVHDPVDINKLSENIARATCTALVKLLDLLATAGLTKLGVRTTIHPDNVGYEAGSEGTKLPPIYMKSLDNELIQVLHKAAQNSQDTYTILELIFYILDD